MPSPTVPQTNKLVPYNPQVPPSVDGITLLYLKREFDNVRNAIKSIEQIMVQLEARIKALGG